MQRLCDAFGFPIRDESHASSICALRDADPDGVRYAKHVSSATRDDLAAAFPDWAQYRWVIEATPDDPPLAIARRNHVKHLLEASNVPARVQVDVLRNRMVQGEEAILINQHFLRQVQSGSPATQTGSGFRGANLSRPPAPAHEGSR